MHRTYIGIDVLLMVALCGGACDSDDVGDSGVRDGDVDDGGALDGDQRDPDVGGDSGGDDSGGGDSGGRDADDRAPACTVGEPIEAACRCDGVVHGSGWCCSFGHSNGACAPENAFYVREGASPGGDGTDWDQAFESLPAVLTRGATYFVASGVYEQSGRSFADDSAGADRIELRKATASNHGTEQGWDATYGEGQAVFGPLIFEGDHYVFDGSTPYGFRVVGAFEGLVVEIQGDGIHLIDVELDGNFAMSGGHQSDGACNGMNIHGSDVTIESCDIHNIADDGVGVYGERISILASRIHGLQGCGTDGGCGPCYNGHSDGLELQDTTDVEIVGNMVYDIESTAALITGQWTAGNYTRNLTLVNNIFYTPATGLTVYLYYVQGARVYNNVIWGRTQGNRYGGLAIGPETTDLELQNNIILNINYSHLDSAYDETEHHIDSNLFADVNTDEYTPNTNDLIADPLFAGVPVSDDMGEHIEEGLVVEDFLLQAGSLAIDVGAELSGVVDSDIRGSSRPRDGNGDGSAAWDLGPIEM